MNSYCNRSMGRVVIGDHEAVMSGQRSAVSRQQKTTQRNLVLIADS
ncbi:MAG: hypothetical protein HY709_11535 [Candidatus Latescibacteria bacterium]|nr:hypothetical protein [Candidatus Latescibacterota bacterium]